MLKTLVEFFLFISTDKKTITYNDISTFYLFITKKLSEIENYLPGLISSSLNNSKNYNEEIIYEKEEITDKINKNKKLKNIQNELLSLFNDMIDFLYE